jgi:3-hydroxymyristoyl/3-hydroxydecanoyl-(acyl carrier protein) dehydratase
VVPGDTIVFEVELVSKRRTVAKIRGRALVNDEVVCEAEMLSALAEA